MVDEPVRLEYATRAGGEVRFEFREDGVRIVAPASAEVPGASRRVAMRASALGAVMITLVLAVLTVMLIAPAVTAKSETRNLAAAAFSTFILTMYLFVWRVLYLKALDEFGRSCGTATVMDVDRTNWRVRIADRDRERSLEIRAAEVHRVDVFWAGLLGAKLLIQLSEARQVELLEGRDVHELRSVRSTLLRFAPNASRT
ncbi:MAG TPA: hypothetical protein VF669_18035 [Tepidisphaeraceae bacterium]|jgi:hypothetical protein